MGVLGVGEAHGACSLLHAAGIGYGASLPIALNTKVALRDNPPKNDPDDPDDPEDPVEVVTSNLPAPGIIVILSAVIGALFLNPERRQ